MDLPRTILPLPFQAQSLIRVVLAVTLGCLLLSFPAEYLYLSSLEHHWPTISEQRSARGLDEAAKAFGGLQRTTRRIATELAQHPVVVGSLAGTLSDRSALFDLVCRRSEVEALGVEIYGRNGDLAAWDGPSGPPHRKEVLLALDGSMASYVSREKMVSQLFVVTPVRNNGLIVGAILLRRTIDVEVPLTKAFFPREGLSEQLAGDLGTRVQFDFSGDAPLVTDSQTVSAPVYGIDSSLVGTVSLSRPSLGSQGEGVRALFERFRSGLILLVFVLMLFAAQPLVSRVRSTAGRIVLLTAVVWGGRYLLLWVDIPSSLLQSGIFDPALFASKFGGGLAKSIGELTLTTLALTLNAIVSERIIAAGQMVPRTPALTKSRPVQLVVAVAGSLLLFWLLRGYGAAVRSAVFDSTMVFNDPGRILPSLEQAVVLLNLLLIGLCAVLGGSAMTRLIAGHLIAGRWTPWVWTAFLYAVAAVVFGLVQENPLMSTGYRLFAGALFLGLALWGERRARDARSLTPTAWFIVALGSSMLLLFPLLEENARAREHQRVETFAREALKPVDNWLKFVVDDALRGLQSPEIVEILTHGDEDELARLAFTGWVGSVASREGYACVFAVVDSTSREISRFAIGGQSAASAPVDAALRDSTGPTVVVRDVGRGINAAKVYGGATPIHGPAGRPLAYARVIIVAGEHSLFRGENPSVLRPASRDDLASLSQRVTISEFREGRLRSSTAPVFPLDYEVPDAVRARLADSTVAGTWASDVFDEKRFDSFFVRRAADDQTVVALSLREFGLTRFVLAAVKLLLLCVIIVAATGCVLLAVRYMRGGKFRLSFRATLLLALLVTATIPLLLITVYGRYDARERLLEATALRLQDQTSAVGANLLTGIGRDESEVIVQISPPVAEAIAADLGTDFNLYIGNRLAVSSRPELFQVGILDERMSGSAFENVVLRGKRFHLEQETIGRYEYAVGYRPILDAGGGLIGVVSIPTLFRQDAIDEEVAGRNAILLGTYSLVLIFLVILAAGFASRIAAPIHQLTEATKRVARGELDVSVGTDVPLRSSGDEIGELIRSFDAMTRDLKASREELIRYERDMAWKEMAQQVAHEIKNPLTPMKLSIQHLRQTFRDRVANFDEVFESVTRTVIDQIDALSRIASEFSHFARLPRRKYTSCDVNAILGETMQLFAQESSVTFDARLAGDLPAVSADHEELRRAFINIIRNSIQAMEGSGTVTLATAVDREAVLVTIADNGPGISDEVKGRLFQPNFSTKTEGMGLGLAIVKETIDHLGGTITVNSTAGQGTTVIILIPAERSHEGQA